MNFDKEINATGLSCPLPILRCKKGLSEINATQILKVIATDPGSVKDFNAFCAQTGHELLQLDNNGDSFTFFIKKRSN